MSVETRLCQNCKQNFRIEEEDFEFYQKIKVPPPTWCPECRMKRRIAFRNERTLYKRKCDLCKKDIVSIYSPNKAFIVYGPQCYWSDNWDPKSYGKDYDFSRSFFEQFKELQLSVPRMALMRENAINSDYTNHARNVKNCYLDVGGEYTEDGAYSTFPLYSKNYLDSYWILNSEFAYELIKSDKCHKAFYSFWCFNSHDVWFSYDCSGCSNVIGGYGLRNKSYSIFNQAVSKEEFFVFKEIYLSGSYEKLKELSQKAYNFFLTQPHRSAFIHNSIECTGNFIESSKNSKQCWHIDNVQDSKFLSIILNTRDSYDIYAGINNELTYECMSSGESNNVRFSYLMWTGCRDMDYCNHMYGGNNCFGSIGLKKESFCVLNKQYSKDEYFKLREKIIQQTNEKPYRDIGGREYKYGEFFPYELSPFGYNETVAQDEYPLSQEEAMDKGYNWENFKVESHKDFSVFEVSDNIKEVDDDVLEKVLKCEVSGRSYRIIRMELEFYRKFNLPLPRRAPLQRHRDRLTKLLPAILHTRKCACAGTTSTNKIFQNQSKHFHGESPCPNEFQTSYAPDRPEIVYCEKCYQNEIQ